LKSSASVAKLNVVVSKTANKKISQSLSVFIFKDLITTLKLSFGTKFVNHASETSRRLLTRQFRDVLADFDLKCGRDKV
jgi:hypothetical protein